MESSQGSGLLERLRAQRESMQASTSPTAAPPAVDDATASSLAPGMPAIQTAAGTAPAADGAASREQAVRLLTLEAEGDVARQRMDTLEHNVRQGLADLRAELPNLVTGEVARHTTTTNEAVADLTGRVTRIEGDFGRERERWSSIVTSFDQRLDHRLRSFRQDVTVMLAGMAVLVLAMLMLLLMRR